MLNLVRSAVIVASLALSPAALGQEIYTNPALGFSISKPSSWHHITAEEHQENLKRMDFDDSKFKELLVRHARIPFFAISKFKEPHDDVNPSIRVNVREAAILKGVPPEKIMEVFRAAFSQRFKDYAVAEGPVATEVSGHSAGYMRMNYTLQSDGSSWRTSSEIWVVPRGDMMFIIGAGTREDEGNGTRKEIGDIIDTIKID